MTDDPFDSRKERVATGIPGLDEVLHGGLLRRAVYMLRGRPGGGKTILANQLCFAHAKRGGRVLYVTLLSETHERMLFNIGQLEFFDPALIPSRIAYLSAFSVLESGGLKALSAMLRNETRASESSLLVVDGLVTVAEAVGTTEFKKFIHDMQVYASMRGAAVLLLSSAAGEPDGAEHTMVDGVIEMRDNRVGKHRERELEVTKFRGSNSLSGGHAFQISSAGIEVFPRLESLLRDPQEVDHCKHERISTGMPTLDQMLHGGLRCGSTCVLFGPTGGGKTTLGLHFLSQASREQPALHFGFYETPPRLLFKARALGLDLESRLDDGSLQISWQAPTERELDALGNRLVSAVRARGVKRLFVDGIDGFVKSAADPDRIPHFFAALTNELRLRGVTALYTHELDTLLSHEIALPLESVSTLAENVLLLRSMEEDRRFLRRFSVVKLRDSGYDDAVRELQITSRGAELVEIVKPPTATRGRALRRLFDRRR